MSVFFLAVIGGVALAIVVIIVVVTAAVLGVPLETRKGAAKRQAQVERYRAAQAEGEAQHNAAVRAAEARLADDGTR